MNCLNDNTQIVTEHLAEHLIELPDIALTAHRISKLAFDHGEGGLNIRPLVSVTSKERLIAKLESNKAYRDAYVAEHVGFSYRKPPRLLVQSQS